MANNKIIIQEEPTVPVHLQDV